MKNFKLKIVVLISLILSNFVIASDFAVCKKVVDGDTIILDSGSKVRLIGVDTPESKHPNKPVQYFSKEATQYLKNNLEGKSIRLEYDPLNAKKKHKGKYGRTLAYVYHDNKLMNKEIIKKGYGHAYTKYPYEPKRQAEFKAAETYAKKSKNGMWKNHSKKSDNFFTAVGKAFVAGVAGQKSLIINEKKKTITQTQSTDSKSGNRTFINGYTRSNGTKVEGYWRSKPHRSDSSENSNKTYVKNYSRSNGTKVKGYWRSKPNRSSSSKSSYSGSSSKSSGKSFVRGYTRSNGSKVNGYWRNKK